MAVQRKPRKCGSPVVHGEHVWTASEGVGQRYYCPGYPELSQDPKDSVANSIAIGRAFRESYDALRAKDEALRELLSYCRAKDENHDPGHGGDAADAYADVVERLAKILDGES